jgi:monovalent cation/hydrogen antiporter
MDSVPGLVALMFCAVLLVALAQRLRVPYPITLVLGGGLIGFLPGVGEVGFDPGLVLLLVLPPILYYSSFGIAIQQFKSNRRAIFSLAVGLVLATTLVIGVVFHWLFPNYPWSLGFVLGAIVSPPDAVAATAVLRRFNISSRLTTVLEGESLINDASGLVLYKLALVALLSGVFSLADASLRFVTVAVGGVAIGWITGHVFRTINRRLGDPVLPVVMSFVQPYLTYIAAEAFNVSGVLAVVTTGLMAARGLHTQAPSQARVVGLATWDVAVILFNCFVFIMIGSQLHGIVERLPESAWGRVAGYAAILTGVLIAVRMLWVFGITELLRVFDRRRQGTDRQLPSRSAATLIGWAGMRGIVSLAAAMSLPIKLNDGTPLPGRDVVVFVSFVIILLTLVLPGLTLAPLIRRLDLSSKRDHALHSKARDALAQAASSQIDRLHDGDQISTEQRDFLHAYFKARHRVSSTTEVHRTEPQALEHARLQVLRSQREHLLTLWQEQTIDDELLQMLQSELDMEEAQHGRAELL